MPAYIYTNEQTGEIVEIFQHMNDLHEYEKDGVKWRRIFINPQAAIDTKWDPRDANGFVEKTSKKSGTVGDLWSVAKELGEKRGDDGTERYSKLRNGRKHQSVKMKELKEEVSKKGFILED